MLFRDENKNYPCIMDVDLLDDFDIWMNWQLIRMTRKFYQHGVVQGASRVVWELTFRTPDIEGLLSVLMPPSIPEEEAVEIACQVVGKYYYEV